MSRNRATIKDCCCEHERANDGRRGRECGHIIMYIYMLLITFTIYILKGEETGLVRDDMLVRGGIKVSRMNSSDSQMNHANITDVI